MNQIRTRVIGFFKDHRYRQISGVVFFIILTLAIHYSYRFWAQDLEYFPIASQMAAFQDFMVQLVYEQSTWIDQHVLGIDLIKDGLVMQFSNGSAISINRSCSGDKQLLQLALLLLIFPGKWQYKLWFIPLGMILVHATNILRIVLLSLVANWKPEWVEVAHDTVLRGMFYVVIFFVWVWFVRLSRR